MVVKCIIPDVGKYIDLAIAYLQRKGYNTRRMSQDSIILLIEQYRKMPDFPTTASCPRIVTRGVVVGQFEDFFYVARDEDGRIIKVPMEDCYVESF